MRTHSEMRANTLAGLYQVRKNIRQRKHWVRPLGDVILDRLPVPLRMQAGHKEDLGFMNAWFCQEDENASRPLIADLSLWYPQPKFAVAIDCAKNSAMVLERDSLEVGSDFTAHVEMPLVLYGVSLGGQCVQLRVL